MPDHPAQPAQPAEPADRFEGHQRGLDSPAERHQPVAPSDTAPLAPRPRALWVQSAGELALEDRDGTVLTYAVQQGQILPFRALRVRATGTTATVYGWD